MVYPRMGGAAPKPAPQTLREVQGLCDLCGLEADTEVAACTGLDCSFPKCPPSCSMYHQACIEKFLKARGLERNRKAGFPCPRGCGKGSTHSKPCPGKVQKSHPISVRGDANKKRRQADLDVRAKCPEIDVERLSGATGPKGGTEVGRRATGSAASPSASASVSTPPPAPGGGRVSGMVPLPPKVAVGTVKTLNAGNAAAKKAERDREALVLAARAARREIAASTGRTVVGLAGGWGLGLSAGGAAAAPGAVRLSPVPSARGAVRLAPPPSVWGGAGLPGASGAAGPAPRPAAVVAGPAPRPSPAAAPTTSRWPRPLEPPSNARATAQQPPAPPLANAWAARAAGVAGAGDEGAGAGPGSAAGRVPVTPATATAKGGSGGDAGTGSPGAGGSAGGAPSRAATDPDATRRVSAAAGTAPARAEQPAARALSPAPASAPAAWPAPTPAPAPVGPDRDGKMAVLSNARTAKTLVAKVATQAAPSPDIEGGGETGGTGRCLAAGRPGAPGTRPPSACGSQARPPSVCALAEPAASGSAWPHKHPGPLSDGGLSATDVAAYDAAARDASEATEEDEDGGSEASGEAEVAGGHAPLGRSPLGPAGAWPAGPRDAAVTALAARRVRRAAAALVAAGVPPAGALRALADARGDLDSALLALLERPEAYGWGSEGAVPPPTRPAPAAAVLDASPDCAALAELELRTGATAQAVAEAALGARGDVDAAEAALAAAAAARRAAAWGPPAALGGWGWTDPQLA